jgi:putative transposase
MLDLFRLWLGAIKCLFSSRKNLLLENLALRQQLAVLKRKNKRPRLNALDRLFWVAVKSLWAGWSDCLLIVTPATVVGWHRAGFRLYWKLLSKARVAPGRKRIGKEMRDLIFRMVAENPTWGAPRIHGELLKLGFNLSERTVSRWVKRAPRRPEPARRWKAFIHNHHEAIAAMDFFSVPTITFGVLYCFFVIGHDRRRILHFGVTRHPTSGWGAQQLREAFPYDHRQQYLIFDTPRSVEFGSEAQISVIV